MKITVIGGGVMGLACAWRLGKAGAQVEVLDAGKAGAATLASLGALWPASPLVDGTLQKWHRESLWGFENFVREISQAAGETIGFRRGGRVELLNSTKAVTRAHQEAAAANKQWPHFGNAAPMCVMSAGEVRKELPYVGQQEFGALVCHATAQVNVAELRAGLREAGARAGVEIRDGVTVESLEWEGKRITTVHSNLGNHAADVVLLTAGAWSGEAAPGVKDVARIRPVKGQGIALRLPARALGIGMILKSGPIYMVPWENEILVGSTTEPEAEFDAMPTAEARENIFAGACQIVPALAGVEIARHWAGLRPQNPVKPYLPVTRREGDNLYICTGHYKTGIGMSALTSEKMAALILLEALRR